MESASPGAAWFDATGLRTIHGGGGPDFLVERVTRLGEICRLGETLLDMLLGQLTLDVGRFRDVLKVAPGQGSPAPAPTPTPTAPARRRR